MSDDARNKGARRMITAARVLALTVMALIIGVVVGIAVDQSRIHRYPTIGGEESAAIDVARRDALNSFPRVWIEEQADAIVIHYRDGREQRLDKRSTLLIGDPLGSHVVWKDGTFTVKEGAR